LVIFPTSWKECQEQIIIMDLYSYHLRKWGFYSLMGAHSKEGETEFQTALRKGSEQLGMDCSCINTYLLRIELGGFGTSVKKK
jgi:hypothetical protein